MSQEKKWKNCWGVVIVFIFVLFAFISEYPALIFFVILFPFILFLSTDLKQRLYTLKLVKCIFPNEEAYKKVLNSLEQDYKEWFDLNTILDKEKRDELINRIREQNEKRDKTIIEKMDIYYPKSKIQKPKNVILLEEKKKVTKESSIFNYKSSKFNKTKTEHASIFDDYESALDLFNKNK